VSGWTLPGAAAAFWAGVLAWTAAGERTPVWLWLAGGVAFLGAAWFTTPDRSVGPDRLGAAGLVPMDHDPEVLVAVTPPRVGIGRGPPVVRTLLVLGGVFLLGLGWGGVHAHRVQGALLHRLAPQPVSVTGTLRTDPSAGTYGWSAVVDVSLVRYDDQAARVHESVWVSGRDQVPDAVRGDGVRMAGEVLLPDDAGFADFLRRRGLAAELRASTFTRIGPSANPLVRAAQAFRAFAGRSIGRLFPPEEAGLLMGLALGDDSRLDAGLARDFQATGLGHLLVVSGENVAMVLAPVLALALALRLRRVPRFLLGLGTVVFFVVLTGAEPSVMRAGVMAGLTLFGVLVGRPRSTASILAGAVLVLLVIDPSLVWAIGFQLSVAATAGMVALATPFAERLRFLPRPIALAAGTTLAAQAGVTPILLFHFREVPGVTILANLLAFPGVSPALLLGLGAAATGLAIPAAGHVLAAIALVPMRYLELVADRLARAPVPWITSGGGLAPLVGGAVLVCVLALWLRSNRRLPRIALVGAVALLPIFVWTTALSAGPPSGLVVRFLDVGEGDAALVTSPGGANVLIDAGPDPGLVATKLSALGVKRLDVVVASHQHADHVAGFPSVLARFPVGLVLEPGCHDPSPAYADLLSAVADEHLPVEHPRTGDTYAVGDLRLDVLGPSACSEGTTANPNDDSIVIRLIYREDVVLFPGDAEKPLQQEILDAGEPVAAEVLKVPHHAGATSLEEFFDAVDPELAVVSVGQPNDFGHPVPEVLDELEATGAEVLRTDLLGDVTVTFAPEGLLVESAA
jgi:competence protein ComEC